MLTIVKVSHDARCPLRRGDLDEHAQVLRAATDVSECDRIVAQISKLVRRLVDRAALCLRQYTNDPNLVVDLENQALQRVMLVAQQRAMPL
jgi:hypothetical protein